MSTSNPKCLKKSAPRMGFCTSAMMKIQGSDRRTPRLRRVNDLLPYVRIGEYVVDCLESEFVGWLLMVSQGPQQSR